jgi:leucyl aminopeptidase
VKVNAAQKDYSKLSSQLLILGVFEKEKLPSHLSKKVLDAAKIEKFSGKDGEACYVRLDGKLKRVALLGLGKKEKFDLAKIRELSGKSYLVASSKKVNEFCLDLFEIEEDVLLRTQAATEGIVLASYKFDKYKKKEDEQPKVKNVNVLVSDVKLGKKGALIGSVLGEAVMFARDIANDPANKLTPTAMGNVAKKIAKESGMKCKVLDKKQIIKQKMNGLLAVSQGSVEEPRFIEMEYGSGKDTVVLVGKGLTFDAGGISLKPGVRMDEMKFDMCGAAAVLGVMKAVAKLKPKLHVVGLVGAAENMPSGSAVKPGDLIEYKNGKSVEVLHTDAEGRLVLADILIHAKKFKPKAMIDFATLTGACVVALGHVSAGLMSNSDTMCLKMELASRKSSEKVWRLPMYEEYSDLLKSDVADLRNLGGWSGEAGTSTAGCFLKEFVECENWAHLDIAGVAWGMKENSYTKKGATGFGIRLVSQLLLDWK